MTEPTSPQQNQQLQVKVSDEVLKGTYSNMVQVGHTAEEFILDFMNLFPPAGTLNSRVIVSPAHFKRMLAAMQDNLKKYEEQYGAVKVHLTPVENQSAQPIISSSSDSAIGFDTKRAE